MKLKSEDSVKSETSSIGLQYINGLTKEIEDLEEELRLIEIFNDRCFDE